LQVEVKENFEIKNLTTFKVGGIVKNVYFPKNKDEFVYLLKTLDEYIVLGNCSNVLISSDGYDGNIILTTQMKDFEISGTKVVASCGVKGQMLSQKIYENSLSGFEFMICFPGTIGGEIYMNASAHGQAISDKLIKCCLFDTEKKEIVYKNKDEMEFSYRSSCLQDKRFILLEAEFELEKSSKEEIQEKMTKNLEFRKDVQPSLAYPNCGSVFKNPENNSAGRLLEQAGVKEFKTEKVRVWQKHANFIVNENNATSIDILELMLRMYEIVKKNYTIELVPEVIYIGNRNKEEETICNIIYKKIQK